MGRRSVKTSGTLPNQKSKPQRQETLETLENLFNQETLFNKVEFPYVVLVAHLKHASLHKELILCKKNSKFAVSRNVEKLYRERENSDKRHRNSVVSRGLYSPISRNSLTEKHSKLSQIKLGRNDSSTEQNSRDVEQGSHCRNPKPLEREICQQPFSPREKGQGQPTNNKVETSKPVNTLPALQDGGFAPSSKYSNKGRLHLKTGFEGCILFSSIKSCIQKICAVSLVRKVLGVSLPLFWTRPSTKSFYKITQNSSFSVASPEHI